ncbi:MAG: SpoIIE family protein phosphatase [Deltaproteobacteria bacterium]|nr:SpoIIE family protein phosphatase [Deltaproteobacteria bacterium]
MDLSLVNLEFLAMVIDSLADGVYVTNVEREILFWNKAAEKLTGWQADEVIGRTCYDNFMQHVDKDGHKLCGKEYCPLHRSITTGQASTKPIFVFATSKDGRRIPMQVTVSPLRDADGKIIGAVEVFRDMEQAIKDLERAKIIQDNAMNTPMQEDPRISFHVCQAPEEFVGGDFYRIECIGPDVYGLMIADVMGHGVASALYTMQLRSLWEDSRLILADPAAFLTKVNQGLSILTGRDYHFATAIHAVIDLERKVITYAGAGHPSPFLFQANDGVKILDASGSPLGLMAKVSYQNIIVPFHAGDHLLFYTDGAVEEMNNDGECLREEGFLELLKRIGFNGSQEHLSKVQLALLRYSNALRFSDDLTLLSVQFNL